MVLSLLPAGTRVGEGGGGVDPTGVADGVDGEYGWVGWMDTCLLQRPIQPSQMTFQPRPHLGLPVSPPITILKAKHIAPRLNIFKV